MAPQLLNFGQEAGYHFIRIEGIKYGRPQLIRYIWAEDVQRVEEQLPASLCVL
jgi:hypothetical protein